MTEVIARVHSVHLVNVKHRQAAADPQTKSPDLGCVSACFRQPPSPFIIITQPESWYSFTVPRRVEGWVDLGTAGKMHTVHVQGCKSQWLCDKHNCPQRDSIPGPRTLQSDMLLFDCCDLQVIKHSTSYVCRKLLASHIVSRDNVTNNEVLYRSSSSSLQDFVTEWRVGFMGHILGYQSTDWPNMHWTGFHPTAEEDQPDQGTHGALLSERTSRTWTCTDHCTGEKYMEDSCCPMCGNAQEDLSVSQK